MKQYKKKYQYCKHDATNKNQPVDLPRTCDCGKETTSILELKKLGET